MGVYKSVSVKPAVAAAAAAAAVVVAAEAAAVVAGVAEAFEAVVAAGNVDPATATA